MDCCHCVLVPPEFVVPVLQTRPIPSLRLSSLFPLGDTNFFYISSLVDSSFLNIEHFFSSSFVLQLRPPLSSDLGSIPPPWLVPLCIPFSSLVYLQAIPVAASLSRTPPPGLAGLQPVLLLWLSRSKKEAKKPTKKKILMYELGWWASSLHSPQRV